MITGDDDGDGGGGVAMEITTGSGTQGRVVRSPKSQSRT